MPANYLYLKNLSSFQDYSLLLLRLGVGCFLIWGVWDNISNTSNMQEFIGFLENFGFVQPELMAHLTVWVQFFVGWAFVLGIFIRWAGIVCSINFIVAIVMVDSIGGIRASFPSACLVLIGLHLATMGAGKFSLDNIVLPRLFSNKS